MRKYDYQKKYRAIKQSRAALSVIINRLLSLCQHERNKKACSFLFYAVHFTSKIK